MERMTLIVKGQEHEAERAAHAHGFKIENVQAGKHGDTVIRALGSYALASAWLCEPGEAPYPAGSLLYYK